ncbi:MAG: DUF4364 family protein [Candidatus Woesearchaeota archaeon]|nr:DUF4364 family protein [Candidatus Woesearchaeota archaeon]
MTERRSKLEIVFDILAFMQRKGGRIKPTHILYGGNLSYNRLKEYIKELEDKELIVLVEDKDKKFYQITDKGLNLIYEFKKIKEITDAFGL